MRLSKKEKERNAANYRKKTRENLRMLAKKYGARRYGMAFGFIKYLTDKYPDFDEERENVLAGFLWKELDIAAGANGGEWDYFKLTTYELYFLAYRELKENNWDESKVCHLDEFTYYRHYPDDFNLYYRDYDFLENDSNYEQYLQDTSYPLY